MVPPSSLRAADVTYWQDARPVLRKYCTVCHNPRRLDEVEISGGLALDTYAAILKRKGKALVLPGKSKDSLLHQVVVTTVPDKRMPLGARPLPPDAIDVLKRWIDGGAKEGTPPDTVVVTPTPPRPRRKLDVLLATNTTPEPADFGPGKAGPLQLALKVGPLSPVVALAFNRDRTLLAAGSYGQVTIWDLRTVRPVRTMTAVLGAVHDVRFSPDGKSLAVGGGQPSAKGDLRIFDVADGKLKLVLSGHDDVVASVAFRPDGKALASASYDRTARTWDLTTGKVDRVLTMHSDFVSSVGWSPDGKHLFTGSKDRAVRMTEAGTGAGVFTFSDRNEDVLAVAVHPSAKVVVATGNEPGLSWWNTETGARIRSQGGHRGPVHELAFDRAGKTLASAGADGVVRLWNGNTGTLVRAINVGPMVYAVALSEDGQLLAAGSFDGLTRLYATASGEQRVALLSLPPQAPRSDWLAITPAGYTAGSAELLAEGRWRMVGRDLPGARVWPALGKADLVVKTVQGASAAPRPTFPK